MSGDQDPPVDSPSAPSLASRATDLIDRGKLVGVVVSATVVSSVLFAGTRVAKELSSGQLTPWWVNVVQAVAVTVVWLWFRRAPKARATVALHITAMVSMVGLCVPVAYGVPSTVWWLSLIGFAAALMGSRREALFWAVLVVIVAGFALVFESQVQIPGAAGEDRSEAALAKLTFAVVLIGIAYAVRWTMERQTVQLAASRAAAERSNRAKARILAHMSHEMRQPLNTIIAMTDLSLRTAELPPEVRHDLSAAYRSSRMLLRLVQDVLDASRLDVEDALQVRSEPFRLHRSLAEVLEPLAGRMADAGLRFSVTAAPGLAERRIGDADRVCQVALNLVSNALKFTDEGEIAVHLAPAASDPDVVCLSVRDTGSGIPAAELGRIFEPFVQVGSLDKAAAGAGLGLTIVRTLVRRMGGRMEVDSEVGVGSEFRAWLRLPVELEQARCTGPEDLLGHSGPLPARPLVVAGVSQLSVLVVDDDPVTRMVLQRLLNVLGHLVTPAERPLQALERLRRERFDVLIADIDMPEMDGLELTRRVRDLSDGRSAADLPVIGLTGHASERWRARAISAGMVGLLTKPFEVDDLAAELQRAIAPQAARPTSPRPRSIPITTRASGGWCR
ncbi:MAG: hypothetical protein CSA66_05780 [Proteobacteria bacterium]|nr:MAG: hypothetical protein CSA66_05780 [Pseudomonadota bacterium]